MEDQDIELTEAEKKAQAKAAKEAAKLAAAEAEEAPVVSVEEYLNELVPFYAIYDGEKYKDDIIVTINGKAWQIQRGQNVSIPRFVFNAIMDAERQKRAATMVSKQFEEQFLAESNRQ